MPNRLINLFSIPHLQATRTAFINALALVFIVSIAGCTDDTSVVREIQAQRQAKLQVETKQDHLGEMHSLLTRLVELNPDESRRQIAYHLNRWLDSNEMKPFEAESVPKLLSSVTDLVPSDALKEQLNRASYSGDDMSHLRNAYLFHGLYSWIDTAPRDDLLLSDWLSNQRETLGEDKSNQLQTATRLFDWTVRNVALEPSNAVPQLNIQIPRFPFGMTFQGPGYRQTDYQTLWRGTGDGLQRAGVFTQLCRQAGIASAVLSIQSTDTGQLKPWAIGVLIGEEVYLFEPELGIFVPGPNQVGIATLAQARSDASVMRRLNIPGFFDYPLSKEDVQQNIALLNAMPIAMSHRMKHLESRLTGDRRMKLYADVDKLALDFDEAKGIAGARLWRVPLLAQVYQATLKEAADRDPVLSFWYLSQWAMLESELSSSQQFALARWRHLLGDFDDNDDSDLKGARPLYLSQRAPEFEIADLRIDVDLQKAYGIRRQLGVDSSVYDRQIQEVQRMMRMGKRTATYWLSLIQYDDGRYDTAETWFRKRSLDENQPSMWMPHARYNLARTVEHLGQWDQAIELYKSDNAIQEHGNRIRARLVTKHREE